METLAKELNNDGSKMFYIPTDEEEKCVAIPLDSCVNDLDKVVSTMKTEFAPIKLWHRMAVTYYFVFLFFFFFFFFCKNFFIILAQWIFCSLFTLLFYILDRFIHYLLFFFVFCCFESIFCMKIFIFVQIQTLD